MMAFGLGTATHILACYGALLFKLTGHVTMRIRPDSYGQYRT